MSSLIEMISFLVKTVLQADGASCGATKYKVDTFKYLQLEVMSKNKVHCKFQLSYWSLLSHQPRPSTCSHAYLQTAECSASVWSCRRRPDDHERRRLLTQCVCPLNALHGAQAPVASAERISQGCDWILQEMTSNKLTQRCDRQLGRAQKKGTTALRGLISLLLDLLNHRRLTCSFVALQ